MNSERFIFYLEGTLTPGEREEIERIVRDDAEQRLEFELTKKIHEGLHALRQEKKAPVEWAETWRYLQERKDASRTPSALRAARWKNPAIFALAAGIMLFLGFGTLFTNRHRGGEKIVLAKTDDYKAIRVAAAKVHISDLGGAIKKVEEPSGEVLISAEIPKNQLGNLKKVLQGQLAVTRFPSGRVMIPRPEGENATPIFVEIIIPLDEHEFGADHMRAVEPMIDRMRALAPFRP